LDKKAETSRVRAAGINIFFGYAGTVTTALLSFILRKIFILYLDGTLLGVNGLYTGILSMLSMAELGIGTAFQFALYKPVAEGDRETVRSYLAGYARAYRIIAVVVAVIGLALTPFLRFLSAKNSAAPTSASTAPSTIQSRPLTAGTPSR
jgi:hypothetical protein